MNLPKQIALKETDTGFRVVETRHELDQMATLFEFDRTHSDMPESYARHFANHIINTHNNQVEASYVAHG